MISDLASVSDKGALFYFNSAQSEFVKNKDPGYLDPYIRGHMISYYLKVLQLLFKEYGFSVIALPWRSWCFLAEYKSKNDTQNAD